MYKSAPLSILRVGAILASPIQDQKSTLLLAAGIEITQELLVKLRQRGVHSVVIEERDWLRLTAFESKGKVNKTLPNRPPVKSKLKTRATDLLDDSISEMSSCDVVASENPYSEQVHSHGATRYENEQMNRLFDHYQQTVDHVADLVGQLSEGLAGTAIALQEVSSDSVAKAAEDMDLFVCMGINPVAENSLFAHSTNVATLAIALGATLGLDKESLCDLGTGCLIHDAGMEQVGEEVYGSSKVLDSSEFLPITKHPVVSANLLYEGGERVPVAVRQVVYQMHERCNGSGYPRGCESHQIHPLAKIAAVADAYVALVSPRPHRPAMLPYFAMAKMLEDVQAGLYDSTVVRGLLNTISLFPIGSCCELADGRVAKVIRTNGSAYDQPIVEVWSRPNLSGEPEVVDLAEEDVKVVKPLTALH